MKVLEVLAAANPINMVCMYYVYAFYQHNHMNCLIILESPDWTGFEQWIEDTWRIEEPVYISKDMKKMVAGTTSFSSPPIGPLGEHVKSGIFANLMSPSFANSYVVNTNEDAALLSKMFDDNNQPQPVILVYPHFQPRYQDLPMNRPIVEALNNETPLIANLVVDHFGHRFNRLHGKQSLLAKILTIYV